MNMKLNFTLGQAELSEFSHDSVELPAEKGGKMTSKRDCDEENSRGQKGVLKVEHEISKLK